MKKIFFLFVIMFAISALADDRNIIKINLTQMKFIIDGQETNDKLVLKTGVKYKLIFENIDPMKHEVLIGRGLENEDSEDYNENLFTDFPITVSGAIMVNGVKKVWIVDTTSVNEIELDDGVRLALYFELPESKKGIWEIGCFMPGHFQMGMRLPVIVE